MTPETRQRLIHQVAEALRDESPEAIDAFEFQILLAIAAAKARAIKRKTEEKNS